VVCTQFGNRHSSRLHRPVQYQPAGGVTAGARTRLAFF
jgi:hypothetical protein